MMKSTFSLVLVAASFALSTSAFAFEPNLNAGPQDQPALVKTIVIDQIVDLAEGAKIVKYSGRALNIMDAATFGDAKLEKLVQAGQTHDPIKLVVRGNVIVDVR